MNNALACLMQILYVACNGNSEYKRQHFLFNDNVLTLFCHHQEWIMLHRHSNANIYR